VSFLKIVATDVCGSNRYMARRPTVNPSGAVKRFIFSEKIQVTKAVKAISPGNPLRGYHDFDNDAAKKLPGYPHRVVAA
jgi:hypothetical protein